MKKVMVTLCTLLALVLCCSLSVTAYAEGEKTDIAFAEVTTKYESYSYRFRAIEPAVKVVVVKDGKRTKLTQNTDYTVAYSENTDAGTAGITVTGIGDYTGTATGSFKIDPLAITEKGFSFTNVKKAYIGSAPTYTVAYNGTALTAGKDYTVSVTGYDKTGYQRATVKISGTGNFTATKTIKATVYPGKVTGLKAKRTSSNKIKLSWKAQDKITGYKVYSVDKKGNVLKTLDTVKTNSVTLSPEAGTVCRYKVRAYTDYKDRTTYGDYSAKATSYTKPEKVTLEYACRSAEYKISAGWESVTCSGYEIKYSTDKKMKKGVKYVKAGKSKTSKKIKVSKTKPYYVKVRAYTVYKGKKKYGKWSKKFTTEFGKLYEYYTTNYVNNPNRTTNLKLACKAIDGTIVYPGETFSFNRTVGRRTESKGYKPAPIFTGSTGHENGTGGGVCQVASTMFNAALYCNFAIVERHQHSQRVAYCPLGRDAAIFWGSEDFKFRNTSKYPIKIRMECGGGQLSCKIYTNGPSSPPKVKLDVSRSGNRFTLRRYVKGKVNYTTRSTY